MAGKERVRLTDAAIARLRPRAREYTVWDSRMPGLGVRVRPTGGRSYMLLQHVDGRSRRLSLGPVSLKGIAEVRRECHERKARVEPETEAPKTKESRRKAPLFREFVVGAWKEANFDGYKPSTQRSATYALAGQLLSAFGSKPLDRIAPAQVRRWFDAFSRTAPDNANNALNLLRQILNFAAASGHIETNSTRGIRRNRRPALTRFLLREEIGRLYRVLDEEAARGERFRQQADVVRFLLLTGCRRGEVVRLRWSGARHALRPPPGLGRVGRDRLDAEPVQGAAELGRVVLVHRAARLRRVPVVAGPVGIERAEQPALADHLAGRPEARHRALLGDEEGRVDLVRGVVHGDDRVPPAAGNPFMARAVPRLRGGRLGCTIMPGNARRGRLRRCAPRLGAGRIRPFACRVSRTQL